MSYIYLASPYSPTKEDCVPAMAISDFLHDRFSQAEAATAALLKRKHWVYSPIVHCHELARRYKLPIDFPFWKEYNFNMLWQSSLLLILEVDGWNRSKGVAAEKMEARAQGIPIALVSPENLDSWMTEYENFIPF